MRVQKLLPAILAAGLILISQVGNANAYFTTYVTAKGGYVVSWQHKEKIEESFNDWSKYINVTSQEGSVPVYVRVKAFAGSQYVLNYSGENWYQGEADGYFYYKNVLLGGETTSTLRISIDNIPATPQDGDNFNVVVVYETIPVQTGENQDVIAPDKADWMGENNE